MSEIIPQHSYSRMQNFIIFEPSSQRVKEMDVLMRGPELLTIFQTAQRQLESEEDLAKIILFNKINKIGRMLDLVTHFDNIIMTKFLDRIWRRYSYLSNLGESFLDLPTFLTIFPDFQATADQLVALRLDGDDEDDMDEDKAAPDMHFQAE